MNPLIDDLLNRWEESCENGQPLTAEQLCTEHPELLEEIRWQIKALQAVDVRFGDVAESRKSLNSSSVPDSRLNCTVQVSARFQIDRLHATGGLGEVYLAKDRLLCRTVAIKFPRADCVSSEHLLRFQREAAITGQLNHPGIVPVHALKQDDASQICYVMRFVDGPTLRSRIEQIHGLPCAKTAKFYGTLEFRQTLQSFVALCNIVAYSHDQGIIHRDIKPSNVVLGTFGETFLMDWGLAKSVSESEPTVEPTSCDSAETVVEMALKTRVGQFMGTPAYASPEQRNGRNELVDTRTDVYSLGATLYSVLTGRLPESSSASPWKTIAGSTVPQRLEAICRKALEENAEQRYLSAIALKEDLELYAAGEPISVVRETVWSKLSRLVRKRSSWVTAILVGVSITVVVGGIGSLLLSQKNQQLRQSNVDLGAANAKSLADQQRSAATTQLLTRAMRAATPEMAQGKEPTVRQLLEETSNQLRTDHSIAPLVAADTHQVLADAYLSLGRFDQARLHAESSHSLHRSFSGGNSASALNAQATLAQILSRLDADEEAIATAKDALQRGRAAKDLDAETRTKLIDVFAHVLSLAPNADMNEILSLHREAFDIARTELGDFHIATLRLSTNLAVALMGADQLDEAEILLKSTWQAHEKVRGSSHPETLVDVFNLISLLTNQQKPQEAFDLAAANKRLFEEVFGVEHLRTIRLNLLIVRLNFELGKLNEAEQESQLALDRAIGSLGPVHEQTLEARGMRCMALIALEKLDEADILAREQYEKTLDAFGATHLATIQAVTLLFDLAEAKNDLEAMASWFEKLRGSPWESGANEALQNAKKAQNKD